MRDLAKDRALCAQLKSHGVHASGWGYVVLEEVKNGFIHYIEQAEQLQQENERLRKALQQVIDSSRESDYADGPKQVFNSHGHYMAVHIAKEALKGE